MADQFERLAQHYANYWKDKGESAPVINFNTKQIERKAEEAFRSAAESDTEDKSAVPASEKSDKPKDKGLNLVGLFADTDDMIEKAIENKVKRIIDRIIDDKIRSTFSKNFTLFENSMAKKIQEKVSGISPKVLDGLKTVAPDAGKEVSKDTVPTSFTESVLDETDEVVDKKASVEVFPGIYVKASKEDETVGEVFIKDNDSLQKMSYVVVLPKTTSKKEYIEALQQKFESL